MAVVLFVSFVPLQQYSWLYSHTSTSGIEMKFWQQCSLFRVELRVTLQAG
jgi:hypothetical protein